MAITISGGTGDGSITGGSSGLTVTSTNNVVTTAPATGGFIVPVGTTAQRVATQGNIRFNSTTGFFEFFDGSTWANVATVTPAAVSGAANTATSYFALPNGTTAQRPGTPTNGMVRYNSSTDQLETYFASQSAWVPFASSVASQTYTVSYLIVAGGGAGGSNYSGGGGGGGGVLSGTTTLTAGTFYNVLVGAGGTGSFSHPGAQGGNSSFNTAVAIGGGGGGGWYAGTGTSGGSGGGAGAGADNTFIPGSAGTAGQGNAGGAGYRTTGAPSSMMTGGGGGAGAVGGNASTGSYGTSGSGGNGASYSISGAMVVYAGGGGGGGCAYNPYVSYPGTGGTGGGAPGTFNFPGNSGVGNSGGGGGGAGNDTGNNAIRAGNGGSGIVIISYPGNPRGTGGTVDTIGGNTIHTFRSSGTYVA